MHKTISDGSEYIEKPIKSDSRENVSGNIFMFVTGNK